MVTSTATWSVHKMSTSRRHLGIYEKWYFHFSQAQQRCATESSRTRGPTPLIAVEGDLTLVGHLLSIDSFTRTKFHARGVKTLHTIVRVVEDIITRMFDLCNDSRWPCVRLMLLYSQSIVVPKCRRRMHGRLSKCGTRIKLPAGAFQISTFLFVPLLSK
ncbi:hypothetical protein KIN20_021330 [Parelaphostrongylus tenuis]|uniref:Uncharacterized protein n=1 Tax=Parelaphostrongylus tenuis TaxID=148309 RepID=A0AAD5N544_PARTN|nr:hypothetical protein KIN20_021330 [Parelaphostrongylus tenuis]